MFSRKEAIKVSLAAALVVGLGFGSEYLITEQVARIKKLTLIASGTLDRDAINEATAKKSRLAKMKAELKKWSPLLQKVEKYFPKQPRAPIQNEQVARLIKAASASLESSGREVASQISWTPPLAAEGEGGGAAEPSEDELKAAMVKYGEEVRSLTIKGDYAAWLDFLLALEQLNMFYRFKELKIKSLEKGGKPDPQTPLQIDVKLASYHVLEFPSDRKPTE